MEIIYGIHAVSSALKSEPDKALCLWVDKQRQDKKIQELIQLARKHNVPVQFCQGRDIDGRLNGDVAHQGVLLEYEGLKPLREADLDELLDNLKEPAFLLILDGVTDPHNLGACMRTADAAGVHAVIAPKDRSVGLTPVVHKVASGASYRLPFVQVTNLARTLDELKQRGIWMVGTTGDATHSLYEQELTGPIGIVMGAEGEGMRRLTTERCDFLVSLPMKGMVESLNVSVATGVVLYEALRQRSS